MDITKKDNYVRSNPLQRSTLTANYTNKETNSAYSEQEEPEFAFQNGLDGIQQGDDMMTHHATTISSSSPIWVPADKHPKISPSEFEHWIKTHSNEGSANTNKTTVQRKSSVLSSVSYNSSEEDSSDDDTMPPTPTIEPLPTILTTESKIGHDNNIAIIEEHSENISLPYCQAQDARGSGQEEQDLTGITPIEESRAKSPENNMHYLETQQLATQKPSSRQKDSSMPIDIPVIVNRSIIDSSDHRSNKKSWFTGLLKDLKKSTSSKTSSPKTNKKAGLAAFFSSKKSTNSSPDTLVQESSSSSSSSTKSKSAKSIKSTKSFSNISNTKTLRKKKRLPTSLARKVPQVPSAPLISRYPLDTERAIYRLSHMKLSNAKRPLQHQVVISNMMYWYLSVTDKQQQQQQQQQRQQQQQHNQFIKQQQLMHQQHQQQQHYNNIYYANSKQKMYVDNVYHAGYHSFEPPATAIGDLDYKNQPNNAVHQRPVDPYTVPPVINEGETKLNTTKKDKYKPVRNTQYEPLMTKAR